MIPKNCVCISGCGVVLDWAGLYGRFLCDVRSYGDADASKGGNR